MKRILVVLFAAFLISIPYAAYPYAAHADITTGLVSRWALDEGSGTTAADSAGSNTGTLMGGASFTSSGKIGGAINLNGTNAYVQLPDAASLRPSAITLSAWFYLNSAPSNYSYITALHWNDVTLRVSPYGLPLEAGIYGGSVLSGSTVTTNAWHHAVVTTNGTTGNLYLDGALVATGAGTINWEGGTHTPAIGANSEGTNYFFNGKVDDVRVYSRALLASDVAELFAATGGTLPANTTYTLSVTSPTNGTVSSSPSGITCPGTCSVSNIAAGTSYTLTATPSNGYTTSWSGCASTNGNACTVTVNSDTTVTPTFTAVAANDTTPPSVPTGLSASSVLTTSLTLSWTASTDSGGSVAGYRIYRNSVQIGTSNTNSYNDSNLTASTQYSYTVAAYDNASPANVSVQSAAFSVTTADVAVIPTGGAVIPSDRTIDWTVGTNVGVRGGIPNRTTICQTISAGATDVQIQAALNSCPSGQVVKLGPGDFTINSTVRVPSNITLRGSGVGITKLNSRGSSFIQIGSGGSGVSAAGNIVGGYIKGSNSLTLSGGASVSVGDFIGVYQDDEQSWVYSPHGFGTHIYSMYRVESVTGSNIGIWPPLVYGSTGFNPKYVRMTGSLTQNAGIEDFSVYPAATVDYPVFLPGAYNSWVKNISIYNVPNLGVFIFQSLGIDIAHVDVLKSVSTGDGYGVVLDNQTPGNTAIAVYNNIYDGLYHGLIPSGQQGSVFAYNYSVNEHAQSGVQFQTAAFNATHNAEGMMSLWEGNFGNYMTADMIHGGAAYQTVFRSRFTGVDNFFPTARSAMIDLTIGSYKWNIVGSILGDASWTPTDKTKFKYEFTGPQWDAAPSNDFGGIYILGYTGYQKPLDPNVYSTIFRYNNYDYWHEAIQNESTPGSTNVPTSLAWTSKPSWFGDRPWPPFDPSNPSAAVATAIPAGYRYINGTDPVGSGNDVTPIIPPSDTTAPTVSITAPSNSATISGTVTLSASASDNIGGSGMAGVQFQVDGQNLGVEVVNPPYSGNWVTTGASNGAHVIKAVARDAAGNVATSTAVSVTVNNIVLTPDLTAPTVPTNLAAVAANSTQVNLSWTASTDPQGTNELVSGVAGYRIYRNNVLVTTVTGTSYSDTGLTQLTTYSYKIAAIDMATPVNVSAQTSVVSASTPATPPPPVPPVLSAGSPTTALAAGTVRATLSLSTDKAAICKYSTVANTAYAAMTNTFTTTGGTTHSTSISNLTDGSTYTYYIRCDSTGLTTTSDYIISFSVSNPPVVVTQPAGGGNTLSGGTTGGTTSGIGSFTPLVQQPTTLPTGTTCTPTTIPSTLAPLPAGTTNFTIGTRSAAVTTLQTFLVSKGYLTRDSITGYYGLLTNAAVVKYKAALLPRTVSCPTTSVASGTSRLTKGYQFSATLILFATNAQVKSMQIFLNDHGYTVATTGSGSKGNETTYFGNATKAALIKFQKANNISPAIGNWGPLTRAKVNSMLK